MSTFFNRIIGNIATRVMFIIYISIIFITSFFIIFSYYNELELQTLRQYDKLSTIVSSAAVHLNGDAHEELIYRYSPDTPKDIIRKDPIYRGFSNYLEAIVKENDLSPMYTLVYNKDDDSFVYGVRSDDFVDFKNPYKQPPKELKLNFEIGGTIPMYESENGMWLSAFYPIKNTGGEVIALIEADIEFSEFEALVNERYLNELMIALGVIIMLALILIPYARRVLLEDDKQKQIAFKQKNMIEAKNRDIMDSIRYALRIQSSILPSVDAFEENGLEGFIFHNAKDVVAGDFYWIEKHDNYLFFAVADCTGHGVPGAIISLICSNALNRAVDTMKIRETGKILDAAREMIIARMGQEGNSVKDGMDISICRLDLKTLELQYSGANNPIYIYDSTTSHFKITTPCKQPVGDYIRKTPFKCKSFQLNKGDVVYLFTDGYADQFGGEKGKKLKYQPFRNLLQTNVQNKMKDQEGVLLSFLEEWMHDFEQVDDICVMGVRI